MSYERTCSNCEKKIKVAVIYCPFCGESVDASAIERRVTIIKAAGSGLLAGEREIVETIDGVCSEFEVLQDRVDHPQV